MNTMEKRTVGKRVRLSLMSSLGALLMIAMSIGGVTNAGAAKLIDGSFTRLSASPKQLRWQGGHITLHIVIANASSPSYHGPKGCQIISSTSCNLKVLRGPRPNHSQGPDTATWAFTKCPTVVTFVVPPNNSSNAMSDHQPAGFDFIITSPRGWSYGGGFDGDIVVTQAAPPHPSPTTTTSSSPTS
jgi:hypothetical protein